MARLSTSLEYTPVTDGSALTAPRLSTAAPATEISYELGLAAQPLVDAQALLMRRAASFATDHGDEHWKTRLALASSSTLLALLPQLAKGDERWRGLAVAAFAEGLQRMWAVAS